MTGTALLIHGASQQIPSSLLDLFNSKINTLALPAVHTSENQLTAIRKIFGDEKINHVAIFQGTYPLLDLALTAKLFAIHTEYRADITYGENLPSGIAPYFVSRDLLESLSIMEAKDSDLDGVSIRAFVEKNINQFHAEVHYEEPDLRLFRLDFSLNSKRSILKAENFLAKLKNKNEPYAELKKIIDSEPAVLHTFPSYIEIEFNSQAEHVSFFSPLKYIEQPKHHLSKENFSQIKEYIATGLGDITVCASGLGEPLEHPDAVSYLSRLLEDEHIRYVFVETNGIYLERMQELAKHPHVKKLRVIVLLNSLDKFSEYSGAPIEKLAKIKVNIKALASSLLPEQVFLQSYKVEENEAEVDVLYALAEELGASFLFQKYNRYAGLMPERRVSNMTPLERYSCWHLRRDLFIRANGDVAFCKQTVDQSKNSARGNLAKDSLAEIWKAQRADFVANYQSTYPSHLPCANCDEYFTFNF